MESVFSPALLVSFLSGLLVSGVAAVIFFIKLAKKKDSVLTLSKELEAARTQAEQLQQKCTAIEEQNFTLQKENAGLQATQKAAEQLQEQSTKFIQSAKEQLLGDVRHTVESLFTKSSDRLSELNKSRLAELLEPFTNRIQAFEKTVQQNHTTHIEHTAQFRAEIKLLRELNHQMAEDAKNLTKALGSNKQQGNWGEFILESILQKSGLSRDREYVVQKSFTTEESRRFQPDVIINLPDGRHFIIDSKVSLTSFVEYSHQDDPQLQQKHLKAFHTSLRAHINSLSQKKYDALGDVSAPEFVFLFFAIESAFALALQTNYELFQFAYDKGVILVSPSNLLATLRMVATLWRQHKQNENAQKIATQAGALYDKVVAFIAEYDQVGEKLQAAHNSWLIGQKRLSQGKGNVVGRIEKLRKLGAKTTKEIPGSYLNESQE